MSNTTIPAIGDGRALEDSLEEDCDAEGEDDEADDVGCDDEAAGWEDADVEQEEGEFGGGYCEGEVEDLQDEETLMVLLGIEYGYWG